MKIIQMIIEKYYNRMLRIYKMCKVCDNIEPPLKYLLKQTFTVAHLKRGAFKNFFKPLIL